MYIYLDIETIPSQRPEVAERIAENLKAPAQYKKEESIANWIKEHGPAAIDEQWRRTALDGSYGEVVCACWAVDDGPIEGDWRESDELESHLLDGLFEQLRNAVAGQVPIYVGHNIGFDLRFLHHRAVVNRITPGLHLPYDSPPWKAHYIDTMHEWCGLRDRIKLIELCYILGIDVDDEIDGAGVWDAWRAGRIDQIAEHCRADVERVRQIHDRLRFR